MTCVLPFGMPGATELLIIFVLIFFMFGAKKLPGIARSVGSSLTSFQRGRLEGKKLVQDMQDELDDMKDEEDE